MSALTVTELEERFLELAQPLLVQFEGQIESLFNEKFAEFKNQLDAKVRGSTSGFHKEKLKSLMDKLVGRMVSIKDSFVSRLQANVERAILEAEDGSELSDSLMQAYIEDNSASAIDSCITLFHEESNQIIIEGLGELTLDDTVEPTPDEDNSMSESMGDSDIPCSDAGEQSDVCEDSFQSEKSEKSEKSEDVVVRIQSDDAKSKKKSKSKITSMLHRKAKKTASGNFRPVP